MIKSDKVLNMENSTNNCEECCRSCSCGDDIGSSIDDSSDAERSDHDHDRDCDHMIADHKKRVISMSTTATQTPTSNY